MTELSNKTQINMATYHIDKFKHLIDSSCPPKFQHCTHIHAKDGALLWYTLNKNEIETNENKYYIAQLLKHDTMNSYFLIIRSGRVGFDNKKEMKCFLNEDKGIEEFSRLFLEKTGYQWSNRANMTKADGKYDFIEMEIEKDEDPLKPQEEVNEKPLNTKLDVRVEPFINLIFDLKNLENTMSQFKIDTQKAPLGKISSNQIKKAYGILGQIQSLIKNGTETTDKKYMTLSSAFYTLIPTSNGNNRLPTLMTEEQVNNKSELLDILSNMEIVGHIMSKISHNSLESSKVWQQYMSLGAEIKPLTDPRMVNLITKYLTQTQGSTHSIRLKIRQMYEVNRLGEAERFQKCAGYGNRQLLWHGSRVANQVGIISQGLRIAPPEAPATGYMFGKGIYTASSVSKSANYMAATNGVGVMLLLEVALGQQYQKKHSEYITSLPAGYHSTWGMGQNTPDAKETVVLEDGLIIPLGHLVNSHRTNLSLMYDEYIVYNVDQVRIRYALILDTNY